MTIGMWLRKRGEARLRAHMRATMRQITVEPAGGRFNFRCHENAAQWLYEHPEKPRARAVEVLYLDAWDESPILHYVIQDGGKFLEVTLGYQGARHEYYYLRALPLNADPSTNFDARLEYWLRRFGPPLLLRKLFGVERIC
jgi:hypothetical protein